jgi:hypothetical protein
MITPAKRKKMEQLIYDVFDAFDKSGSNTDKYKSLFKSMTDQQFNKFFSDFFDTNEQFQLDMIEYERPVILEDCIKAADVLGIKLWEYVYMPHITGDKSNVVKSKYPVLWGYLNIKRPQQVIEKKNGMSPSIKKRNQLTNQVVSKDKNGADTGPESSGLMVTNSTNLLKELHGARSDDMASKSKMYTQIADQGYVSLEDLDEDATQKTTLNLLNTYFIGKAIKSDVITDSYILPMRIRNKQIGGVD